MKTFKIKVVVGADGERQRRMRELLVESGLAVNNADAGKLIKPSVHDVKIQDAYFIAADGFDFRDSPITLQRLFQCATAGLLVLVGCKKLPHEFEFLCDAVYV